MVSIFNSRNNKRFAFRIALFLISVNVVIYLFRFHYPFLRDYVLPISILTIFYLSYWILLSINRKVNYLKFVKYKEDSTNNIATDILISNYKSGYVHALQNYLASKIKEITEKRNFQEMQEYYYNEMLIMIAEVNELPDIKQMGTFTLLINKNDPEQWSAKYFLQFITKLPHTDTLIIRKETKGILSETTKKVGIALDDFYNRMAELDQIKEYQEREGKKATLLIMTINDIEGIFYGEKIKL